MIQREVRPNYLQLYTPCILEIGKNSMEGLQEMRDSEKPTERLAYKEYISEPAKQLLAQVSAKHKGKKAAAKQLASQGAYTDPGGETTRNKKTLKLRMWALGGQCAGDAE